MTARRIIFLILLSIILFIMNLYFGAVDIPFKEVTAILAGKGEAAGAARYIVLGSRLPQALTALLAGAGLSVCGLLLQTSFRNPLAGPSILGISSGASLGVALVILLFGGIFSVSNYSIGGSGAVVAGALAGSVAVLGLLIYFSMRIKSNAMLLIAGMMMGYLTSSIVTLLSSLTTAQGIQGFVVWGMGSFGGVSMERMPMFAILSAIGILSAIMLAKPLNLLLLGDDYARNLGVKVVRVRNMLLLSSGLLAAIVTAYCGPISFIGIAIPHIARMIFRTDDHFILMPATLIIGGASCLLCNLGSTAVPNHIIPLNALTPLVGVPVILYVILRRS